MASSLSNRSEEEELKRLHRLLMTDIANSLDQKSMECHDLFYHIKSIVGQGIFSEKKSVQDKLSTLVTRGIIQPGKNYEKLIQICEDSGNISTRDMIIRHVQEMDEFRKQSHEKGKNRSDPVQSPGTESNSDDSLPCTEQNQVIEQQMKNISHTQSVKKRKSSGNASQGSHQKRKLSYDSLEPEKTDFQPRPSTSKCGFSRADAIENAYSDDADPPKKRKYRSESSELEVTDALPRPTTIMCDFGLNEEVENVVPGCFIKKEEKKYMYAFILLQQIRDILVPFCDEIIKHQHQTLLQTVQQKYNIAIMTCSVCTIQTLSPSHVRSKKNRCPLSYHNCNCLKPKETYECPIKVCGAIYDELIKLHIRRSPFMKELDISKLYNDPWEVAKCFLPYYYNSNSLEDIDINGILHIIINSKSFNDRLTTMDPFYELREMRNSLVHRSSMDLMDSEFASYGNILMNLLNILELKNKPETNKALKFCEQIKKDLGIDIVNEKSPHLQSLIYKDVITNDSVDENLRVVVLGSDDQGKTSLVRKLLGQNLENIQPTEEIDVHQCIVKPNGDWEIKEDGRLYDIEIWDVGGNFVNYATHQVFLTTHAVYIIVFNLKKGLDAHEGNNGNFGEHSTNTVKDIISHWVNSIHTFVGTKDGNSPQIILVGTQSDGVQDDSHKIFRGITKLFCKSYAFNHLHQKLFTISNTFLNSTDISELRSTVLALGRSQLSKAKREKIPTKWKVLANEIKILNMENKIITLTDLQRQIVKIGTQEYKGKLRMESNELQDFLKYQHEQGEFCYFQVPNLSNYVITDPMLLVVAFKRITLASDKCNKYSIIKKWNQLKETAILHQDIVDEAWRENSTEGRNDLLLEFLKECHIIAYLQCNPSSVVKRYLIPSFLKSSAKSKTKRDAIYAFLEGKISSEVSLKYEGIPERFLTVLFNRILAALISKWPICNFQNDLLIFDSLVVCEPRTDQAILLFQGKKGIELLTVNLVQKEVSSKVCDEYRRFVESIIKEHAHKLCFRTDQQEQVYMKIAYRCRHSNHGNKGSKRKLRGFKSVSKDYPCPDRENHVIKPEFTQKWFSVNENSNPVYNQTKRLTVEEYNELALSISGNFHNLSKELGISDNVVEQIEDDYISQLDQIFHLLLAWDEKYGEQATFAKLVDVLKQTSGIEVNWDEIKNMQHFISNSSSVS